MNTAATTQALAEMHEISPRLGAADVISTHRTSTGPVTYVRTASGTIAMITPEGTRLIGGAR